MKFRKKPVVIEAWPFYGNRTDVVHCLMPDWLIDAILDGRVCYSGGDDPYYIVDTLEGEHRARVNDWIIRGIKGELYPCKPDIFDATYDPVSEDA
jgi:hypothetical protein